MITPDHHSWMKCQEPHAQARSPSGETLNLSELFHCLLCEMGSFLGAVAGCRWADPATLLETGAEVLLLFLLMTVEGWGTGEVPQIICAGLFQSEMVLRPEALGLSGTPGSGDSPQAGWQCGRPLCSQPECQSGRLSELLLWNKHICLPSRRFHLTPCSSENKFLTAGCWHENRYIDRRNKRSTEQNRGQK